MNSARRSVIVSVFAGALAACAGRPVSTPATAPTLTTVMVTGPTSPTPLPVELRHESSVGERAVDASVTQVWGVLPEIFAQLEIETTTVDAAGAIMGNGSYRARRIEGRRLSSYLDCGRLMGREHADTYTVTLGVLVRLATAPDGRTLLWTVVDAYARDPGQSSGSVHCITLGSLERRIGDLVVEKIGA